MINKPILITGVGRSGTSMVAGIMSICGAWGGTMNGPFDGRQRGIYENTEIGQSLIKGYFRLLRMDPLGQYPLPDLSNPETISRMIADGRKWWEQKVQGAIQRQGYKEGPWFIKGTKICLIWPLWRAAFPEAKWIIVRRNTDDIVKSCMNTGFMKAYRTEEGWKAWVRTHEDRFTEMRAAGLNASEIRPQQMIDGDLSALKELIVWAGLEYNEKAIKEFISPTLWKEGYNGVKSN